MVLGGIRHRQDNGVPWITQIHGAIPAADEFNLWEDELAPLVGEPLEAVIDYFEGRLATLCCDQTIKVTREAISLGVWINPMSPAALWLMHHTLGTGSGSVCLNDNPP